LIVVVLKGILFDHQKPIKFNHTIQLGKSGVVLVLWNRNV